MSKYEISIWSDVYDETKGRFVEQKEIIIGSNTMTSENRARDPKLVNNIDGTNKFTFDMYYRYIDTRTGEEIENPYIPYLVNERKIKVLWKDEWYDLLIKQIKEDQAGRVFSYTCEDSYITELSRTGFELEFATELENNIGTAEELINKVIENTDWRFDKEESDPIYQLTEEPVYESYLLNNCEGIECPNKPETGTVTLLAGYPILVYYSMAPNIDDLNEECQIYYAGGDFQTDQNDMLAINGHCYNITLTWQIEGNKATAYYNEEPVFQIDFDSGLSTRYRAERYVQSQQMVYNDIVGRYVNVYNNGTLYGYSSTEYNDALAVVNIVTNSSNFKNLSGWTGEDLYFKIYPPFGQDTIISEYEATSYFRVQSDKLYFNSGIQNNRTYISDGFIQGEHYVFRIKAKTDSGLESNEYVINPNTFTPIIAQRTADYNYGEEVFEIEYDEGREPIATEDGWLEYNLVCIKSCSYESLLTAIESCGIFLYINGAGNYWLEDIQFFREVYGDKEGSHIRINPNEMATQSIAQPVWKYFLAEQPEGTTKDTLEYVYTSPVPWQDAQPDNNNYERYGTIEESQSNRFNILQSIAEKFQCWVRFKINHNQETGAIEYKDGLPEKYIIIKTEAGQETGIGFIYGVDLKDITRNIKSNQISTKTIVLQNDNEFGQNGFCSIARSTQNYSRENVIYNFDYYVQHSLLDGDALNQDLFSNTSGLKYYPTLHTLNVEYANNLDSLINKKTELTRQTAMRTVYEQYLTAARDEQDSVEDSIKKLAGVEDWDAAMEYAQSHWRDTKVQSLIDDRTQIIKSINMYESLTQDISTSINSLEKYIEDTEIRQQEIIDELRALNAAFYNKYSRYIQEGTWSSDDYWDDDLYYLDAIQVAYESSRPQISYEINVLRLSELDDYSSKIFKLGDISFIQDVKYFGYLKDGITPYKEKVVLTEITSYFDTPDKDSIKVQNYKNQFDDLFQRITAATQTLEFSEGKYAKAANIVQPDGTIKSSVIQNTFNSNKDLVYGAQNESITMDNTGISVTDNGDASHLLKITSGGVFVSADGGDTWKNAIRGDGINTDLLTAGRINTTEITVYNSDHPSFRWDALGLNAYKFQEDGSVDTNQFVRFDQYGVYGLKLTESDDNVFIPSNEQEIYNKANFGLTWNKFFMKSVNGGHSIEISTERDIVVREQIPGYDSVDRVVIGRINPDDDPENYGMIVRNQEGDIVFQCDKDGSYLSGWKLNKGILQSTINELNQSIQISADGSIGSYGNEKQQYSENTYHVQVLSGFSAEDLRNPGQTITFNPDEWINVFQSSIGALSAVYQNDENYNASYNTPPSSLIPVAPSIIQLALQNGTNYRVENINTLITLEKASHITTKRTVDNIDYYHTTYTYLFKANVQLQEGGTLRTIFAINSNTETNIREKYVPASETQWYIDKNGSAIFHNIYADGGQIAGWWIDNESIYQTYDGTREKVKDGKNNVKTQLNSNGVTQGNVDYSVITDAINAAIGTVGGLLLQGGLINGYNIATLSQRVDQAVNTANGAWSKANNALSVASGKANAKHTHWISRAVTSVNFSSQTYGQGCSTD